MRILPAGLLILAVAAAAVCTPARIEGDASGSSTRRSRAEGGRPSASADSRSSGAIPERPASVFRTMGSSE